MRDLTEYPDKCNVRIMRLLIYVSVRLIIYLFNNPLQRPRLEHNKEMM